MWLVDATACRFSSGVPEWPKQTLARPGVLVTTRQVLGRDRFVTDVRGGRLDGELIPWECEQDAVDGHQETVMRCRTSELVDA